MNINKEISNIQGNLDLASVYLNGFSVLLMEEIKIHKSDGAESKAPIYAVSELEQIIDSYSCQIGEALNQIRGSLRQIKTLYSGSSD